MNETDVIETLTKVKDVVVEQVTDAIEAAKAADLHKDRDVLIGAVGGIVGGVLLSSALFWVGVGYLVYHFVRRDDHERTAVTAALAETSKDKAEA